MFNSKKNDPYFFRQESETSDVNPFVMAGQKLSAKTESGNGALKFKELNSDLVTDFGSLSGYRKPRGYDKVAVTMSKIWAENPRLALNMVFYPRLVTRNAMLPSGQYTTESQRGAGLRNEGRMRLLWLAINHPKTFYANAEMIPSFGSWEDIFWLLEMDYTYNGWSGKMLDWYFFASMIKDALNKPYQEDLVKKYLPTVKTKDKCTTSTTMFAHVCGSFLANYLFKDVVYGMTDSAKHSRLKKYRLLKSSGKAHTWQQLISTGQHSIIDFGKVHGRALYKMVRSKYLKNQKLEAKYSSWLSTQKTVKYTGYIHELFHNYLSLDKLEIDTLNKQFLSQVDKASVVQDHKFIGVVDTSGSMSSNATGTKISSRDIAKSLALYMSYLLPEGVFADSWIEFSDDAILHKWKGSTPYEKFVNAGRITIGSTNFQSVIDLFIDIKREGVDESAFPTGIVCFSDGEFNRIGKHETNFSVALKKLRAAGFSDEYVDNFLVILWDIRNDYYGNNSITKFESHDVKTKGVMYLSGYDGAIVSFLVDGKIPSTAEELFFKAMEQEIFSYLELVD